MSAVCKKIIKIRRIVPEILWFEGKKKSSKFWDLKKFSFHRKIEVRPKKILEQMKFSFRRQKSILVFSSAVRFRTVPFFVPSPKKLISSSVPRPEIGQKKRAHQQHAIFVPCDILP